MISKLSRALLVPGALIALGACMKDPNAAQNPPANETKAVTAADQSDPTTSAQSAAPASISGSASIVQASADGTDPMCFDGNAGKWADAWIHHKPPPANVVGVIYMLEGGTDASNTDPYATKPTADNDWVKTGPHVMIVGSKEILAGHPSGGKPDTSVPYVMWSGTPYAHLMVPTAAAQ
jgi:hypothetical protein